MTFCIVGMRDKLCIVYAFSYCNQFLNVPTQGIVWQLYWYIPVNRSYGDTTVTPSSYIQYILQRDDGLLYGCRSRGQVFGRKENDES